MINVETYTKLIKETQTKNAQLVAVSKTKPVEAIMELYQLGQRVFGENKVQELVSKQEVLPNDIQWHLIGSLQRNKVKYIIPFVSLIHSVDSLKLLQEIEKEATKVNRVVDCLLQFHIAEEETKFGLTLEEAQELLSAPLYKSMQHVRIVGLMGMATFTNDNKQIRKEFKQLANYYQQLKETFFRAETSFCHISMGMSGDYEIALEEGSTLVRVGSLLFGSRT